MQQSAQPYSVLVAEDNLINQKVLEALLKKWGYNSSLVSNGIEVLELLSNQMFDAIILDYHMPELNGLQTVQKLRNSSNSTINGIPILFLTSETNTKTIQALSEVGNNVFLKKPIEPDVLYHALTQIITKVERPKLKTAANVNYLRRITDGNKKLMAEIISLFIKEVPINIAQMKYFCLEKDWDSLYKIIHKTRSNYKYVSLDESEFILRDFEIDIEKQEHTETYLARIIALEQITIEAIERLIIKKQKLLR